MIWISRFLITCGSAVSSVEMNLTPSQFGHRVGLEAKARVLHEDITKNWLARELAKLNALIDRSNEKGWRKALTLSDYLDSRKLLRSPEEQSRLEAKMPKVIADELEVGPTTATDNYQEIAGETEDPPTTTSVRSFGMPNFVGSSDAEPLIQIPNNKASAEFWLPVLAKEPKEWSTIDQNQPKVVSGIDENGSAHTGVRVNQLVENSNYEERPLLEAYKGLEHGNVESGINPRMIDLTCEDENEDDVIECPRSDN